MLIRRIVSDPSREKELSRQQNGMILQGPLRANSQ